MPMVTELPDELSAALDRYRQHFGAPAFRHFQTYICGLIVSDNLTIGGINRTFLRRKHPSSLNRFLTWSIWGHEDVIQTRLETLKAEGDLQGKVWLVLDNTLTHKAGKAIEAVGVSKDHGENRYVLVHNIVTTLFIRRDGKFHPLHFRPYHKEEYCKEKGVPFKTKIDLAKELVDHALSVGLEIEAALIDNWFAWKKFIRFLKETGLHWVTRLMSDGNVKIQGQYVAISDFAASFPREALNSMVVKGQPYRVFSKAVNLKGVGRVRILINYETDDFSDAPVCHGTDNVHWMFNVSENGNRNGDLLEESWWR